MSRIVTGDESWIYAYDPEQSNNRRSAKGHNHQEQKKMARQVRSSTKIVLIVFEVKGIVHREFVPPSTTVNSDFYRDVLILRENVPRKRPEHWLNHHTAPAHTSMKTTEFVTNNNMVITLLAGLSPL
jgi:hypothetical protein